MVQDADDIERPIPLDRFFVFTLHSLHSDDVRGVTSDERSSSRARRRPGLWSS